ncbi:MAG TPA: hypothetical protein VKR30_00625 [Candidatus Limnocylindrales bacterium]|nr:hypothetical protein [Candidatus Limnocylindrales bacterium]
MADKRTVEVRIVGDATGYKKALAESEQASGKSGSIIGGVFAGVGIAATNLAVEGVGKVIDFLGDSSKVARDAEVTTTRLTTALRDNVKGFTGTAEAMTGAVDAGRRLGFTGDELRASLAALVTVTKNQRQAQVDAAAAEDLARARGIDLASATNIVIKAQEGNVGALRKLGIIVPAVTSNVDALKASHEKATPAQIKAAQAADKAATATAALAAIQRAAQGQAEAYAGTMQGSLAVAGTEVEAIQERLGETLNRIVAAVLPPLVKGLSAVADWFGQVAQAAAPFVAQVVDLGGQLMAALADAFNQIAAAVQPLIPVIADLVHQDLEVLASVIGTVAKWVTENLIPAFVQVAKSVLPPLRAGLEWLAHDVLPSVRAAIEFVAAHAIPPLRSALEWVTKNVLPPLGAAFDWIVKNVLPPVVAALRWIADNVLPALGQGFAFFTDRVLPAVSGALQAVGGVVGKVFGAVAGTVKSAINAVIGLINGMIRAIDSVQFHVHIDPPDPLPKIHFDWNGVGLGQLPYLHAGGLVPGTPGADVLAVLQAGERVVPRGSASGPTVVVNINGGLIDGPTIDALTNALARRLSFAPGT